MKIRIVLLLSLIVIISSCSKEEDIIVTPKSELTTYQSDVISYFKEIALGLEFGGASKITRKRTSTMRIFVGGTPDSEHFGELEKIKNEINSLATDGFSIEIISDSTQSNFYIFFGSGDAYGEIFPSLNNLIDSNWGLFSIFWNNNSEITTGYMYVDIERANPAAQKHLLREELTQSLGLAKDSFLYQTSIFQQDWTTTNEYVDIDKDLIRLLYHPDMSVGLNSSQVDDVLTDILLSE